MNQYPSVTGEHIRSLTITVGLLDWLLQRSKDWRFSKIEAFRNLLSRLPEQTLGEQTLLGVPLDILPGQVIITDSELAQTWSWHRATVKSFLCTLEDYAVLTMRRETKFSVLTFPAIQDMVMSEYDADRKRRMSASSTASVKVDENGSVTDGAKTKRSASVKTSRQNQDKSSAALASPNYYGSPSLFGDDDFQTDAELTVTADETHLAETVDSASSVEKSGEKNPTNYIADNGPSVSSDSLILSVSHGVQIAHNTNADILPDSEDKHVSPDIRTIINADTDEA